MLLSTYYPWNNDGVRYYLCGKSGTLPKHRLALDSDGIADED